MKYDKSMKMDDAINKRIKGLFIGTLFGTFISIILLILFSMVFIKMKSIPSLAIEPISMVICAISAFLSAYASARIIRENGMVYGIISGFVMFMLMFFSWMIFNREAITTLILVKITLMLLMGAIGGIIGVNKREH